MVNIQVQFPDQNDAKRTCETNGCSDSRVDKLAIFVKQKKANRAKGGQQPCGGNATIDALQIVEMPFFLATFLNDAPDPIEKLLVDNVQAVWKRAHANLLTFAKGKPYPDGKITSRFS
jgi:hypothetical protein